MPLNLFVPKEDQEGDCFSITIILNGKSVKYEGISKNLFDETTANLRMLAKKIGLSGASSLKKIALATEIVPYVFFTTLDEAVVAWPILAQPLENTESDLRDQSLNLRASAGYNRPNFAAHFRAREAEIQAAIKRLAMEAERKKMRENGRLPPAWWNAGRFEREEDWEEPTRPYIKVIVEVTDRDHDGYCSGIDEDDKGDFVCCFSGEAIEIQEYTTKMIGWLPLKDEHGANWNFQGADFDPGWGCSSTGSGACGIRPTIKFLSMERVE